MNGRDWGNMPAIMNLKEVARLLGVGYRTALTLAHKEGFPSMKLGKKWLVNRDLLRSWLEREAGWHL